MVDSANGVSDALALAEQRAFFEQVFAQSSLSTQILDKDGWCERINSKLSELFGVQPEAIEGHVYNIFNDAAIQAGGVVPYLERVFYEGKTAEWEVFFDIELAAESQGIAVLEKKKRWFQNWAYPIFDAHGAVSHVIIQHLDITERKVAAEALAASEERFRVLFEGSADALNILDPSTVRFTSANPAMLALFRAPNEAALLSVGPAQISPERQPDGRASAEKVHEMGEFAMRQGTHAFEWTHRRLTGEDFPASVVLARIEVNGRPFIQATIRDETEKKRLEARLAQGDRLASMGMLAAGVAHEINNPLAYVLASVELLATELPTMAAAAGNTDLLHAAASALEGTRRIASIARGLSTFARVERGERAKVELHHAIDSAATLAHNEIKFRATLVKQYGELPPVWASEGKLSQVFLNLLINAAHATPQGDVAAHPITVRTWVEGNEVFAEVRDTGRGISPENLSRVFEPFFTTKKAGRGSGLGLAICKTLLAEFGGDLRIESELGKGTRAIVRLPIGRGDPSESFVISPPKPESDRPTIRGRVLVVDDEEQLRSVLQRMLRREHDVVTVASGREAQALLERDTVFDVILCDLMMPDVSGIELHAWLVVNHPALAKKVVFVSGGAFTPEASEYLSRVDCPQLGKPFEFDELRKLVRKRVAARR